jgi:hypothetical protein
MSLRTIMSAFLIAAALSGCDPPPEPASSALDGTYVGSIELAGNNNHPTCPKVAPAQFVVAGGTLDYDHYHGAAFIHAMVHADGSFFAWSVNRTNGHTQVVEGQINGGSIEASASNALCKYQVRLKRVHSQQSG